MPLNLSGKGASGVNSKEQGKINEKVQGGTKQERRVITYLPPPRAKLDVKPLPDLVKEARREEVVYARCEDGEITLEGLPDVEALDPYNRQHSQQESFETHSPPRQAQNDVNYIVSGSSPTVVEHCSSSSTLEDEISVKLDEIIERYPRTRAAMSKVGSSRRSFLDAKLIIFNQ